MTHAVTLTERQLEIIYDLLGERLEDINEDIAHYEEHPEELAETADAGEEPLGIQDYEAYRDEVQTLLDVLPAPAGA